MSTLCTLQGFDELSGRYAGEELGEGSVSGKAGCEVVYLDRKINTDRGEGLWSL